ncbi:MAG: hypothetical protein WEB19_01160 [Acidimicrobiia bacterium]
MTEIRSERVDRWLAILRRVHDEILEVHHHREIWDFFNVELPKQPDPGIVHQALARWYVDSQAAAIRRIYEPGDKQSLGALMKSLEAHASELKRADFLRLWHQLSEPGGDEHGIFREMANDAFDKFAGPGGEHVDPATVAADRARLKGAHNVSRWASEHVAHIGREPSVAVTFDDLDAAISLVGELHQRYYLLLTASSLMTVTPVIQEPWQTPFTRPWLAD